MPCIPFPTEAGMGFVCSPSVVSAKLFRGQCPTCGRSSYMTATHAEWYGWSVVCLRCGERWEDGERSARPFEPRWRKRSIEQAKRSWRRLPPEIRGEVDDAD